MTVKTKWIVWFKWGLCSWGCLTSEVIMCCNLWELTEEEQGGYIQAIDAFVFVRVSERVSGENAAQSVKL